MIIGGSGPRLQALGIGARRRVNGYEQLFRARAHAIKDWRGVPVKLGMLVAVGSATLIAAGVWAYELSTAQLNNAITLQRCVLEIEQEQRVTGRLPRSVNCIDYWGAPIAYIVRDGTYLLVSAGADGQPDANYDAVDPAGIPSASTCLARGADTVFVGRHPVRYCLK